MLYSTVESEADRLDSLPINVGAYRRFKSIASYEQKTDGYSTGVALFPPKTCANLIIAVRYTPGSAGVTMS